MFNVFLFALLLVGYIACGSIESVPYRTTWPVNSDDQTTWPVSSDDELIRLKTISNGSQAIINNVEQAKATVTPESIPTPALDETEQVKLFLYNFNTLSGRMLDVLMWGAYIEDSAPDAYYPITQQNIALLDLYLTILYQTPEPEVDDIMLGNLIVAEISKTAAYKMLLNEIANGILENDLDKINKVIDEMKVFGFQPIAKEASAIQDRIIEKYNINREDVGLNPKEEIKEEVREEKSQKDLIEELLSPSK